MLFGEAIGAWLSDRYDRRALVCFISLLGAVLGLAGVLFLTGTYSIILMMAFSMFMWGQAHQISLPYSQKPHKTGQCISGRYFQWVRKPGRRCCTAGNGSSYYRHHTMDSGLLFIVVIGLFGSLLLVPLLKNINSFLLEITPCHNRKSNHKIFQWHNGLSHALLALKDVNMTGMP